jgi:hypothetical protein
MNVLYASTSAKACKHQENQRENGFGMYLSASEAAARRIGNHIICEHIWLSELSGHTAQKWDRNGRPDCCPIFFVHKSYIYLLATLHSALARYQRNPGSVKKLCEVHCEPCVRYAFEHSFLFTCVHEH